MSPWIGLRELEFEHHSLSVKKCLHMQRLNCILDWLKKSEIQAAILKVIGYLEAFPRNFETGQENWVGEENFKT